MTTAESVALNVNRNSDAIMRGSLSTVRQSMMQSCNEINIRNQNETIDLMRSNRLSASVAQKRIGMRDSSNLQHTNRSNERLRSQMLSRLS